jgi:hypothetical protein
MNLPALPASPTSSLYPAGRATLCGAIQAQIYRPGYSTSQGLLSPNPGAVPADRASPNYIENKNVGEDVFTDELTLCKQLLAQ